MAIAVSCVLLLGSLLFAYPLIVTNWLPLDLWRIVRADRFHPDVTAGDAVHRLHSLALGVIAWGMLLGVVLQFRRPKRRMAALLASLAVPVAISVGELLAGTFTVGGTAPFLVPIVVAVVLHPAARSIRQPPRWDRPMLGLVAAAALPWMMYAVGVGRAAHSVSPGFEVDHLTFMSALGLLSVLWGIIGASKLGGWPYAAGASLVATASMGLQSVIFPDVLSGLPLPWAVAALAWCLAYASAAIVRWRSWGERGPRLPPGNDAAQADPRGATDLRA